MIVLIVSLILFILLLNIIYFFTPVTFKYLVSPILIPLYLSLYQKYYQNKKDKELLDYKNSITKEIELYKSNLTGSNLVTKLQFELEFSIYKELYSEIMTIYLNIETQNKEIINLQKTTFDTKVLQYMPYIEDDIFNQIGDISILIKLYFYPSEGVTSDILLQDIKKLSQLIKKRIDSMRIIE
ncbi:MAG: hypothetical protein ACRCY7_04475 [Cetobacterium sp.]|uniref:hypothetical protein n=1 Tax=Cetobacterium sp. TaxID=2071632 RepID=UPI003F2C85EF